MSDAPIACVEFPDFELQILRRLHHLTTSAPIVVVRSERPGSPILAANEAARSHGIRPGMRYAYALSLTHAVQAGVVSPAQRLTATGEIIAMLERLAPAVEQWPLDEAVFWLDRRGTERLMGDEAQWRTALREAAHSANWDVRLAIGWTRPGTVLMARTQRATGADTPQEERRWMQGEPLVHLPLTPRDGERLHLLGITKIEDLCSCERRALKIRFSRQLLDLHTFLTTTTASLPVQRHGEWGGTLHDQQNIHIDAAQTFEPPLRFLWQIRQALAAMIDTQMDEVINGGRWIEALVLRLRQDHGVEDTHTIRSGRATRDRDHLLGLFDLRMERRSERQFSRTSSSRAYQAVDAIGLTLITTTGELTQETFSFGVSNGVSNHDVPEPDPLVLDRVVALLQAEFGDAVVSRWVCVPGRFPEERFHNEPIDNGRELLRATQKREATGGTRTVEGTDATNKTAATATATATATAAIVAGSAPLPTVTRIRRFLSNGARHNALSCPAGTVVAGPYHLDGAWWKGDTRTCSYRYERIDDSNEIWWVAEDDRPYLQGRME